MNIKFGQLPEKQLSLKPGARVIADYVRLLPNTPGVYRMIDKNLNVLYVGKANNLKKRVSSYTRTTSHSNRILRMIEATTSMEFITTASETEALLLEANLIKKYRPYYNVLLRDDKTLPYILIHNDHDAPRIVKFRGARGKKGRYFGPFAAAGAVNRTINILQRAFLLRSCSDSVYANRSRPCLLYQIKRCSAPCTGEISLGDYHQFIDQALEFLSGKSNAIRSKLLLEMENAAHALQFEQAADLRDRISALTQVQADQGINLSGIDQADVFAITQTDGRSAVEVFFFRAGQNWGNRVYYPRTHNNIYDERDILEAFIAQFYDNKPVPPLILVSHQLTNSELLGLALSSKSGYRVEVRRPQRGKLKAVIDQAMANAQSALARQLSATTSNIALLAELSERLKLAVRPRRIEIYDNSHIQGNNPVGAMVVFTKEGLCTGQYRIFNIKSPNISPGDDLAMMGEVLTRRFNKVAPPQDDTTNDDPDAPPARPDLIIIDGGQGQLNVACQVLKELDISGVEVIAVAKGKDRDAGRETLFIPGQHPLRLPMRDKLLYFIQRLRDEAHRFAISRHRHRRKRATIKSRLDQITGIGAVRKRVLLVHFGSVRAISGASIVDLCQTPGISNAMAKSIYDHFHSS